MRIHGNFTGGNIEIAGQRGNTVWLRPALRDTAGRWFYWAFCVEGAALQTVTFTFGESLVGYFGPAVSRDGETWEWAGKDCLLPDGRGFTFTFKEGDDRVFFAHHLLYPVGRVSALAGRLGVPLEMLAVSNGLAAVPCLRFGGGERQIWLTARHHCCESTGSYVLEGVAEALHQCLPAGFRVLAAPFMDYDGVLRGDQGKNRIPHDHNRDYIDEPLYAEVRALTALAKEAPPAFALDFHAPWHSGGGNDKVFLVRNLHNPAGQDRFSALLANACHRLPFPYDGKDDIAPNAEWNQIVSTMSSEYLAKFPGVDLALTLETAYFGTPDRPCSQESLVALGRGFGEALCRYIEEA